MLNIVLSRPPVASIIPQMKTLTCTSSVLPSRRQQQIINHHLFASMPSTDESSPSTPSKRKTRRRTTTESLNNVPSLADFMHRAKVLKQYRSFIRLALFLDGQNGGAGECRAALEEVRVAYKLGVKKGTDSISKSMAFSEGERKLKELQSMVGFVPKKRSTHQPGEDAADDSYDPDSWMNIADEDDKRGRVGVQWPWEQTDDKK